MVQAQKFWLTIMNDMKQMDVEDVLFASVNGLPRSIYRSYRIGIFPHPGATFIVIYQLILITPP
jgi:hypothetical protein